MKLQAPNDEAIVTGIETRREFKIKATAKSFKILSSQIYTDKLGTAPRELGANAYDAHKANGNTEEPFLVHLPNNYEPHFSIRDYGTGMSQEKIETLYVTYFESDKTDSNDYIGGLGLGSKSPFSYVEQFTVVSYYNGKKIIASSFLQDGIPNVAILGTEDTTERNGMEISFPVKSSDIYAFNERVKKIYSVFKIKPIITGIKDFVFTEQKYVLNSEQNRWALRENINNGYSKDNSARAVMGNIGYPIDVSQVFPDRYTTNEYKVLELPFDIEFNIGELEIVASREGLEYDENTIKVIKKRVKTIIAEFKVTVQKRFDECLTRFEAHSLYGELFGYGYHRTSSQSSYHSAMVTILAGTSFNWKNIQIKSEAVPLYDNSEATTLLTNRIDLTVYCHFMGNYRNGHRCCKQKEATEISCASSTRKSFFVIDLPKGSQTRIRYHIKNNPDNHLYVMEFISTDARKKFVEKLGILDSDILGVSSLPKPPRTTPLAVRVPNSRRVKIMGTKGSWDDDKIVVDPSEEYYYVKMDNRYIDTQSYGKYNMGMESIAALKAYLVEQKMFDGDKYVYGFQKDKKLIHLPNAVDFVEFAIEKFKVLVKINNIEQGYADYVEFNTLINDCPMLQSILIQLKSSSKLKVTSRYFLDLKNRYEILQKSHDDFDKSVNFERFKHVLNSVNFTKTKPATHSAQTIKTEFEKKYPMAKYLTNRYQDDFYEDLVGYINEKN